MLHSGPSREKQKYWERRLWDLLEPIGLVDLLIMSWSIEAFRDGRTTAASKHTTLPGTSEEHAIGGKYFIPPWSIDAILNEKLALEPRSEHKDRYLNVSKWGGISRLLSVYSRLANVESIMDFDGNEILASMPRLLWPQYDWQLGFENTFRLARAWFVYVTPESRVAFWNKHSLGLDTFIKISFAVYAATSDYPTVRVSNLSDIGATPKQLILLRKIIGGTPKEHMKDSREIRDSGLPRDFRRSSIKERPLFTIESRLRSVILAPSRSHLLLRMTDGIYYDIVQDQNARRASGEQFEKLCFELMHHYTSINFDIEPEKDTSYGKSVDFFLRSKDSLLTFLIECKSRRIPQRVLTSPDPWGEYHDDFEDIVKGIVQVWRTYNEFTHSLPENTVGVVLQYDYWTIMGGAFLKKLFQEAHNVADDLLIPIKNRIPTALVGFADFENCLASYDYLDVRDAINESNTEKFFGYELSGVLDKITDKRNQKPNFDYRKLIRTRVPWWGEKP